MSSTLDVVSCSEELESTKSLSEVTKTLEGASS